MHTPIPGAFPGRRPSPFLGSQAIRDGSLTEHRLRANYRAVFRNVYLAKDVPLTPLLRAQAAWLFAGPDAVLSGMSAAAVYGTKWLDIDAPAELVRADRHAPDGLRVHSYALAAEHVRELDSMRVTTPARTAFDLGRLLPSETAIPILDALMNKTGVAPDEVWSLVDASPGIRGIDRLRTSLGRADGGAESPLETQTRLRLSGVCVPGLETQIPLYDPWGLLSTRIAMGWRRFRVAVECDEETDSPGYREWMHGHTAELESRGWVVMWVTASMAFGRSDIAGRVREKLLMAHRQAASLRGGEDPYTA